MPEDEGKAHRYTWSAFCTVFSLDDDSEANDNMNHLGGQLDIVRFVVMMMLKMMRMMRMTSTWVDIVRSVVTPRDTRAGIAFWSSQKLT